MSEVTTQISGDAELEAAALALQGQLTEKSLETETPSETLETPPAPEVVIATEPVEKGNPPIAEEVEDESAMEKALVEWEASMPEALKKFAAKKHAKAQEAEKSLNPMPEATKVDELVREALESALDKRLAPIEKSLSTQNHSTTVALESLQTLIREFRSAPAPRKTLDKSITTAPSTTFVAPVMEPFEAWVRQAYPGLDDAAKRSNLIKAAAKGDRSAIDRAPVAVQKAMFPEA